MEFDLETSVADRQRSRVYQTEQTVTLPATKAPEVGCNARERHRRTRDLETTAATVRLRFLMLSGAFASS
jgi:hypothetical protein